MGKWAVGGPVVPRSHGLKALWFYGLVDTDEAHTIPVLLKPVRLLHEFHPPSHSPSTAPMSRELLIEFGGHVFYANWTGMVCLCLWSVS